MQNICTVMSFGAQCLMFTLHLLMTNGERHNDLIVRSIDWPVVGLYYVPGLDEPEACSLTRRGQAIFVENVSFTSKNCTCESTIRSKSPDKSIRRSVRSECNGKGRCALSQYFILSDIDCGGCSQLADSLKIDYTCRHFSIKNTRVFNMSNEFEHQTYNRTPLYLILTSTDIHVHRSCNIAGVNVTVTLMYVEFGAGLSHSRRPSENNQGRITVDNDNTRVTALNWNNVPEGAISYVVNKSEIHVLMIHGLIWIEVQGNKKTNISCNGTTVQQFTTQQEGVEVLVQYVNMPVYLTVFMSINVLLTLCVTLLSIFIFMSRGKLTSRPVNSKHTYNVLRGGPGMDTHNYQRCIDTERVNSLRSKLSKSGTYCEVGHDQWSLTELLSNRALPSVYIDPMSSSDHVIEQEDKV